MGIASQLLATPSNPRKPCPGSDSIMSPSLGKPRGQAPRALAGILPQAPQDDKLHRGTFLERTFIFKQYLDHPDLRRKRSGEGLGEESYFPTDDLQS